LAIYWPERRLIGPHQTDDDTDVTCYTSTRHNPSVPLA